MRIIRAAAGLAAIIAAVPGLSLATTAPAAAAVVWEIGTWRPYGNTNPISSSPSTWHCDTSVPVGDNVVGQICAVRASSGHSVQAAMIVRNNRSYIYTANGTMELFARSTRLSGWTCPTSGVAGHSWSVCFGRTLTRTDAVYSYGYTDGVFLGVSPNV